MINRICIRMAYVVLALTTLVFSTAATADMMRPMPANGVYVEAIFGADQRAKLQPSSHPFVVKLLDGSENFLCTGVVVAAHSVMTAAHCTGYRDGRFPRSARSIRFIETAEGGRFRVKRSCVSPEYSGEFDAEGLQHITDVTPDIAIVRTVERISGVTGTVRVSTGVEDGDRVFMAGYHSDDLSVLRGQSCAVERFGSMWVYDRLEHRCDSISGSSGAPLLRKRRDGGFEVVGIHSGTADDGSVNFAALIGGEKTADQFVFDTLAQDSTR